MKAVITGSGFESANFGEVVAEHKVETELGWPSSQILEFESLKGKYFWLRRHGKDGAIPPHRINYRANILALAKLGVTQIVSVNTVGGISKNCPAGSYAIPVQIIDQTWGRESTFFDGDFKPLKHIDFSLPIELFVAGWLREAAEEVGIKTVLPTTIVCTQGPRLETAAEIEVFGSWGAEIVGMTIMPEAALARELDMDYAAICPVVNAAANYGTEPLIEEQLRKRASEMLADVVKIILQYLNYH